VCFMKVVWSDRGGPGAPVATRSTVPVRRGTSCRKVL
jgi:hypothetical protein